MQDLPLIVIEIVLVFGGVLAFGWWQFRDLANERRKRQARQARQAHQAKDARDAA